jgi:hypothetical protein
VVLGICAGIELDTSTSSEEAANNSGVIAWVFHALSFPMMVSVWGQYVDKAWVIPTFVLNSFAFGALLANAIQWRSRRAR